MHFFSRDKNVLMNLLSIYDKTYIEPLSKDDFFLYFSWHNTLSIQFINFQRPTNRLQIELCFYVKWRCLSISAVC